jgi:hypothetical protein
MHRRLRPPNILELKSADFAIIGTDITNEAAKNLPAECRCGPDELVALC